MENPKSIYELKNGEYTRVGGHMVFRVPGGWLYTLLVNESVKAQTFVPYSSEFLDKAIWEARGSECEDDLPWSEDELPEQLLNFQN